jgi:hypothetical protein
MLRSHPSAGKENPMGETQPSTLTQAWETAFAALGFTLTDPAGEAEARQIAGALELMAREEMTAPDGYPGSARTFARLAGELRDAPAVLRAARR